MKQKLLLFILALFTSVGAWATSYYFVGGRTSASDLTTGKKYMIYNTAKRYFVGASGSGYAVTNNTTPLAYTTTNANYVWELETGTTSGTFKIKNEGTSTYSAGGTALGSAVDYTIADFSTCPSKGGMASYNDDGTTTAAASITATDKTVYIVQEGTDAYWNDASGNFGTYTKAHVYVLYEVIEIVDGGCYTIDFESNDGSKFWALSSSGTAVSVTQQTSVAQGSVFVAHAYVNAQGQQRWVFVNNTDGYFLSYKEATATFNHEKPINEFALAAIYKGVNSNVTTNNCNGKLYITTDDRSTSNTDAGCYILKESTSAFDTSKDPYFNGTYTSAMKFTPNSATASATATLAIAKFNALYQVKDVVACASNMSALFAAPGTLIDDINAAATADEAANLATTYMKSAEGKKFYAVCSGATGQYLNVGTSVVSATSTELTAEAVMELEYAGYGKYYIKGVKSGYYANVPVANNAAPTTTSNKGAAGSFFIGNYANTNDNEGVYFAKTKLAGGNTVAFHYSTSYTYRTCGWGYDAGNSHWNITAISDDDYDILANVSAVTYNVILAANGTVKATATKDVRKGHDIVLPSEIAKDYCTYTYYSDVACTTPISVVPDAATTTVYALVSYTKFTISSDFASATWYYATLRGKYLRADDDHKDDSGRYQTNSTNEHTDAYKWAFFGNPYDGFYVMNKNQGSSKYLYKGTSQLEFQSGITPTEDNNALFAVTSNSNGGFTLRNIAGGATWYINDAGNDGNLGFWNSGSGANDGGSNWLVTEVPDVEINVTYELYAGGQKIDTYVDEYVAGNSAINIPASWTTSFIAYDLTTSGTIGTTDCTIEVTATLKSSSKTPAEISNSKKYRLVSARGGLSTYTEGTGETAITYLASPCKTSLGVSAKEFAILSYGGRNYLYSVSDEKFVIFDGVDNTKAKVRDNVTGTADAITFTGTSNFRYAITFNNETSKYLNSSNSESYPYGIVVNGWGGDGYWDDGNRYVIEEVGDFDSSTALSALTTFLDGQAAIYATNIAALKAINWSDEHKAGQLNRYNFIGSFVGFAGDESNIISGLETEGYTSENLQVVQAMNQKGISYALNMPQAGMFLRVKGGNSGKYVKYGDKVESRYPMGDADKTAIFYFDGTHMLSYSSGIYWGVTGGSGTTNWDWTAVGGTGSTIAFAESNTACKYFVKLTSVEETKPDVLLYDNTTRCDRGGFNGTGSVTDAHYTWELEEVTTLPITLNQAKTGEPYFGTICLPVAVTLPTGLYAYSATAAENNVLTLTKVVEGGVLAANAPVVLYSTDPVTTGLPISDAAGAEATGNEFDGTIEAITAPAGTNYVLSKDANDEVGFYKYTGSTIPGFKAYYNVSAGNPVKGFTFSFEDVEDAIRAIETENNNLEIYDIAGRRVQKAQKGLYIINGKKVMFK